MKTTNANIRKWEFSFQEVNKERLTGMDSF